MTDQKPTGVFLRLPLSNEQLGKLLDPTGSLNERMLAVGTPVQGVELERCGYARLRETTNPHTWLAVDNDDVSFYKSIGNRLEEMTPLNVAQAQIAARDSEILRLKTKRPHYDRMVQENGELKLAVTRLQSQDNKELTQVIEERDECEQVIADLYQAVMGDPPEWSNSFGYRDAVNDVVDCVHALRTKALKGGVA